MKMIPFRVPQRRKAANIAKHGRPRKRSKVRSGVREASSKAVSARLAEAA